MKRILLILAVLSACTLCLTVKKKLKIKMESTGSNDDESSLIIIFNSY